MNADDSIGVHGVLGEPTSASTPVYLRESTTDSCASSYDPSNATPTNNSELSSLAGDAPTASSTALGGNTIEWDAHIAGWADVLVQSPAEWERVFCRLSPAEHCLILSSSSEPEDGQSTLVGEAAVPMQVESLHFPEELPTTSEIARATTMPLRPYRRSKGRLSLGQIRRNVTSLFRDPLHSRSARRKESEYRLDFSTSVWVPLDELKVLATHASLFSYTEGSIDETVQFVWGSGSKIILRFKHRPEAELWKAHLLANSSREPGTAYVDATIDVTVGSVQGHGVSPTTGLQCRLHAGDIALAKTSSREGGKWNERFVLENTSSVELTVVLAESSRGSGFLPSLGSVVVDANDGEQTHDMQWTRLSALPGLRRQMSQSMDIEVAWRISKTAVQPHSAYLSLIRELRRDPLLTLQVIDACENKCEDSSQPPCMPVVLRILEADSRFDAVLADAVCNEIHAQRDSPHLVFRQNTFVTKAFLAFVTTFAGSFIQDLCEPLLLVLNQELANRTEEEDECFVKTLCDLVWKRLLVSGSKFPKRIGQVLNLIRTRMAAKSDNLHLFFTFISASIVLRFLCSAILRPHEAAGFQKNKDHLLREYLLPVAKALSKRCVIPKRPEEFATSPIIAFFRAISEPSTSGSPREHQHTLRVQMARAIEPMHNLIKGVNPGDLGELAGPALSLLEQLEPLAQASSRLLAEKTKPPDLARAKLDSLRSVSRSMDSLRTLRASEVCQCRGEIEQLRAKVEELQLENEDLRAQLRNIGAPPRRTQSLRSTARSWDKDPRPVTLL